MTENIEKDKQLLKNIDRILTGRESEITKPLDDDTRTAVDFVRKMVSMREKPSKEFEANLKAQLIHQLAEQQKREYSENEGSLFWHIPRRTRWQGTIAALIAVIIIAIILLIIFLLHPAS